mgnify:CR=1 FL=1
MPKIAIDEPTIGMVFTINTSPFAGREGQWVCLLYTSDAADERSSVDLGGRRIIKTKQKYDSIARRCRTLRRLHVFNTNDVTLS